jgi:hypothetical protein
MKIKRLSTLTAATAALTLGIAASAPASIVVGKSIGGLKLGMTQTQAKNLLQATPTVKHYTNEIAGASTDLTWQGITATFAGNANITNVETTLPTERTSTGVGVGSTLAKVHAGLSGEICEGAAGTTLCRIGALTAGQRVTTFRIKNSTGRVFQVGVGFVID